MTSAEALAADVDRKRSVVIEIKNVTNNYCLMNPKVFLDSGETYNPPSPTVCPLKTEVCIFTKSSGKATGCVGVMTYDIFEKSRNDLVGTLGLMFSVPWDYNLYKNWVAVGVFKIGSNCDEALYKVMYYEKDQKGHGFTREEATGSGFTYQGQGLNIMAVMSPMAKATMRVEMWDNNFSQLFQHAY
ncbi:actinoporin-like protein [Gouania willdenowi]|uniref:DELTA-stichotoxin-She4a-like n=1 Tax=Gouania willdenowi TaxID=441366 RepID=A0A8C5EW28_GOUWI|nr:DELTA-stichotoxin-She4a-like [Gouania willdenowi]